MFAIFDEVYSTGRAMSLREFRAQMELPDTGERVEFHADLNCIPRTGAGGEVVGVTIDMTNATDRVRERKAAQQRVADAERRYARALDLIDALQRELLPAGVPVLPRHQLAASYPLADADTAAGGGNRDPTSTAVWDFA